jgi:hypothetical protein
MWQLGKIPPVAKMKFAIFHVFEFAGVYSGCRQLGRFFCGRVLVGTE